MHAASLILASTDQRRERADIDKRRKDFDQALKELRLAKDRLRRATDLYLERLEGTRNDAQQSG